MKDREAFAAQDGIDYGKWCEFMKEAESFNERVLHDMVRDLCVLIGKNNPTEDFK